MQLVLTSKLYILAHVKKQTNKKTLTKTWMKKNSAQWCLKNQPLYWYKNTFLQKLGQKPVCLTLTRCMMIITAFWSNQHSNEPSLPQLFTIKHNATLHRWESAGSQHNVNTITYSTLCCINHASSVNFSYKDKRLHQLAWVFMLIYTLKKRKDYLFIAFLWHFVWNEMTVSYSLVLSSSRNVWLNAF